MKQHHLSGRIPVNRRALDLGVSAAVLPAARSTCPTGLSHGRSRRTVLKVTVGSHTAALVRFLWNTAKPHKQDDYYNEPWMRPSRGSTTISPQLVLLHPRPHPHRTRSPQANPTQEMPARGPTQQTTPAATAGETPRPTAVLRVTVPDLAPPGGHIMSLPHFH